MRCAAILFIFFVNANLSRAEWVIQQLGVGGGTTNLVTMTITADKVREEIRGEQVGHVISINDMNTFDQTVLYPETKTFKRIPGSKIKDFVARFRAQSGNTNAADAKLPKPVDLGRLEDVGGYACEVYQWTNGRNLTNTLWVAKDYPRFEKIRPYLLSVDQFQASGLDKGLQPELGDLPGMVVKTEQVFAGRKTVVTLLSAKEEPDKGSLFQVPNDYKEATRR